MLTGVRALALGAIIVLAGCLGPGLAEPEAGEIQSCQLGGPPRDAPEHREVFNLTEDLLDRLPVLSQLFEEEGHTVTVECQEGARIFEVLRDEGADVVVRDHATGHNAFLRYDGTTLHVTLWARL